MEQLQQIGAQLGIDGTFPYLLGLIFALYFFLSVTYLKPFQRLLEQRRARTEGTKKEAHELTAKADEVFSQYKARLKEVTDKTRQTMREKEELARREEAKLLDAASVKAKASLQNAQKELDSQKRGILESLTQDISGLASEFATKILGRPVGSK